MTAGAGACPLRRHLNRLLCISPFLFPLLFFFFFFMCLEVFIGKSSIWGQRQWAGFRLVNAQQRTKREVWFKESHHCGSAPQLWASAVTVWWRSLPGAFCSTRSVGGSSGGLPGHRLGRAPAAWGCGAWSPRAQRGRGRLRGSAAALTTHPAPRIYFQLTSEGKSGKKQKEKEKEKKSTRALVFLKCS